MEHHNSLADINIQVPLFNGRSYLTYAMPSDIQDFFEIDLTVLTTQSDGLVLFAANPNNIDYILLKLEGGRAVFRFNLGTGVVEISSSIAIDDGSYHLVTIGRARDLGYLIIDGSENTTASSQAFDQLNFRSPLFVGGITDYSLLPFSAMVTTGLSGCVRDLQINEQPIDTVGDVLVGYDIGQCPASVCSFVMCQNNGTCVDASNIAGFTCECPSQFVGQFCESPAPLCDPNPCQGGLCSEMSGTFSCLCPLERAGRLCEEGEMRMDLCF